MAPKAEAAHRSSSKTAFGEPPRHRFRLAGNRRKLEADVTMANETQEPRGLEHAGVIDFFAHDTRRDELVLAMFETRPWDDSDLQLFQLQEKFNAYVSFLLDGELAEAHPELAAKKARIELRCATVPEGRALDLLTMIHDQLALQEIEVEVIAGGEGGCGAGCSCH